ncbi:oligoendopeptidase, pepF/M3 family [Desulfocapsa sulfexigens DSM 10523]|uniref:Oligoendopeptidase, pepF/M3 family n=1 Tax=Desulfocapsa sulfexigens (strain DSM 10523 / SB164P1) TaxID=1167006 RepID=M1P818_DESSD|nr:M3 family oligoendopeptidase [Desulfocapsa sulfexigens]AGF77827.1 oligoendopeptidase, pepF/M3 family [Desulfocapsa sulfexigens DSM 10523]
MSALNDELGTTNVIWNLDALYDSLEDDLLQDDLDLCIQEAELIREGCAGKLKELSPATFARTVRRIERIHINLGRIDTYAFLNFVTQVKNNAAAAFLQKCKEDASRVNRELVFFDLEWAKMDQTSADRFLTAEDTAEYHHYLSNLRKYANHLLSHSEESLLVEFSPVGRDSWLTLFEKLLGHLEFGEKKRSEEEVLSDLYNSKRSVRKNAALELTTGLDSQLHILSHIFNTILAEKMIDDRLRHYPSWVSSRNLSNELEDRTVDALVDSCTERYDIVQRYYAIKKDILGLDTLHDYDRYAPLPSLPDRLVPWKECRQMVLDGFRDFSPEMADIANLFFDNNWIHAPLLDGKRGGAFAHPAVPDANPYVLVNYTGNLRDVSTVAHELGHGIHQYLARDKGYFNSDTPLVLAETASVFAELLIFHKQLASLSEPAQRQAFICQKLESIFATVFRQISMNRFEDMIHSQRRNSGEVSTDDLSNLWMKSQKAMFGDAVTLGDHYKIWWSYIPHFLHTPGYVYSYAFGELLVLALYRIYQKEGADFIPKYLYLLSEGGSKSPTELLAPFNIDLNDPSFWQGGLHVIENMLEEIS